MLHTGAGECAKHFMDLGIRPTVSIPFLKERSEAQSGQVASWRTHSFGRGGVEPQEGLGFEATILEHRCFSRS